MARPRPNRKSSLAFDAITVEGSLIAPAILARIAQHQAGEQTEADYGVLKGLTLREEISRYFRIGQALFAEFSASEAPSVAGTVRFVERVLRDVFGFADLHRVDTGASGDSQFAVTLKGLDGRAPVVVVPPADDLDRPGEHLAIDGRRRSAASALQDWLNTNEGALWGLCSNGTQLRLVRDNASLTRPAYIEANIRRMFEGEAFADFAALWLIINVSRFGNPGTPPSDCALERWRDAGQREGVAARERLRDGVEAALLSLGNGFLSRTDNAALRERLHGGALPLPDFFGQLLRLVYRLIFLLAAEDRNLLHPPDAPAAARKLYAEGYSVGSLRDRAIRRTAWDRHYDRWEGLLITFAALARGEPRLGLPALDGLFAPASLPDMETAKLANRNLMEAIYRLAWLKDASGLVPVNWRDMETEELGSVYESLLELTPRLTNDGRGVAFAEEGESQGHARKTSGSYYTPDSLVQALLDSALDPVLDRVDAEADDPAAALLAITVLDPACGSGHFLLAAARRIATRLARARAGGVASPNDFRHALRDVVRACIHGVDRNPMAVELTKVALWIETVEPGKPLGFLDANIRCGDSLIGVFDLKALQDGIPDAAYKPLPGDDKETARHFEKRNKAEREGQGSLDFGAGSGRLPTAFPMIGEARALRAMSENSPEEIVMKRERFESVRADLRRWNVRVAADLYVAAFLVPKIGGVPANRNTVTIPTTTHVWEALASGTVYGPLVGQAQDHAGAARVFHWPIEFPDIMTSGGFDVVVGNPPWERVKLQEEEFFAFRDPEIAKAKNAAARKRLIGALPETNPNLAAQWATAVRRAASESAFLRLSGRYPLGGVGDVNTYAVFADLFRQSISPAGVAALLLPNGLVTGFTYRAFLRHLLESRTLVSFFGFENEDKLFADVHNETKFGILTMSGVQRPVERPWFTAHIRQPTQIHDPLRRYSLSASQIEAINPNTLNLPAFRWASDSEVAAAIHAVATVLIRRHEDGRVDNPWKVNFRTLFHMANDSGMFLDHGDITQRIVDRCGALAVLEDGTEVYPLYEGKMLWHFDHRYGTYEGQTQKQANKGLLPHVPDAAHDNPEYRIQPRYWIEANKVRGSLGEDARREWFFAWRDVGISERTFIGTLIPRSAAGHKAPLISSGHDARSAAALVAILSSLVVDYDARQRSNQMAFFVVEQLAVPSPEVLAEHCLWLDSSPRKWLADRVLELAYTSVELAPFARELDFTYPPFRWLPGRRAVLEAEINAAVLHLYRLTRSQAEWLLESFTVLRKYEEREVGEFRTKRLVLEVFDALEDAQRTGKPYQTLLAPAAADPSCCHPVRLAAE